MYLRTLGGLALEGSEFRRPKSLLLLAYLALEGAQPRRYLAELFFGDTSDPMNSLSRVLTLIRKDAPGMIGSDNRKVWVTIKCDAVEFLSLVDGKMFEQGLELYKGAFALDYNAGLGEELEEWLYSTREILAAKARHAFLSLAEARADKGDFSQAASLAEKAYKIKEAELEPDDFARLYQLLYLGNSPLAAEVRKEAESFGISLEPNREKIKTDVSETLLESANNLPLPKSSFVGRDEELVSIATQLAKPDCRLLTLHGTGGVGKSRLALQAAYDQLKGDTWEGIYFVALDALNSPELIAPAIAEALGLELQGQDDTLTQVQRFIAKKHLLFVLDNYEHLMAGATLTSKLLGSCPNLKLLVTSRERLNVEEEWVLTLAGLTVPEAIPDSLNEAQHFEAVDMFLQRAKRARLDFALAEGDLPHVLQICKLVDGLPLGIELAAVWVKTLPLSDIAKEIESNLNILETPTKNIVERHQSIRAVFEHSWKLLTQKEQEVLRRLSVFVGGFRREAAGEVAGATLPILSSLVDKSLLSVSENGRYERHVMVFDFTREKLEGREHEYAETQEEFGSYYLQFSRAQSKKIGTFDEIEAIEQFGEEFENIRAAWKVSKGDRLLDFAWAIHPYQERRGMWRDAQHLLQSALHIAEANNKTRDIANLLHNLGVLHRKLAEYQLSLDCFIKSIDLKESLGDKISIAYTQIELGWYHYRLLEYQAAKQYFQMSQEVANKTNSFGLLIRVLHGLSLIALEEGQLQDALKYLQESWQLAQEHESDQTNIARVCGDLGLIHVFLRNKDRSIELYKQAEHILQRLRNKSDVLVNYYGFAHAYFHFKDYETAIHYYQKVLGLAKENEHTLILSSSYLGMAEAQLAINEVREAMEFAKKGLATIKDSEPLIQHGVAARVMGEVFLATEDTAQASKWLTKAKNILETTQDADELEKTCLAIRRLQMQTKSLTSANKESVQI